MNLHCINTCSLNYVSYYLKLSILMFFARRTVWDLSQILTSDIF